MGYDSPTREPAHTCSYLSRLALGVSIAALIAAIIANFNMPQMKQIERPSQTYLAQDNLGQWWADENPAWLQQHIEKINLRLKPPQ